MNVRPASVPSSRGCATRWRPLVEAGGVLHRHPETRWGAHAGGADRRSEQGGATEPRFAEWIQVGRFQTPFLFSRFTSFHAVSSTCVFMRMFTSRAPLGPNGAAFSDHGEDDSEDPEFQSRLRVMDIDQAWMKHGGSLASF